MHGAKKALHFDDVGLSKYQHSGPSEVIWTFGLERLNKIWKTGEFQILFLK
jgi:hypothetical protein